LKGAAVALPRTALGKGKSETRVRAPFWQEKTPRAGDSGDKVTGIAEWCLFGRAKATPTAMEQVHG
jgi:hypothetical protein